LTATMVFGIYNQWTFWWIVCVWLYELSHCNAGSITLNIRSVIGFVMLFVTVSVMRY